MPDHPITTEEFRSFMDVERGTTIPAKGFYWLVHSAERAAMVQYHMINWSINVLLIVQAALSAVFVALGAAGNQYQNAVAVLGAVNGVITGVLAIIKGQGLPARLYQHASGLRDVLREIGRLERIVASGGTVTRENCESLYAMYDRVQKEYDANYPDIFRVNTPSSTSTTPPRPEPVVAEHGDEQHADGGAAGPGAPGPGEAAVAHN
ncbi:uncharacterized protein Z520_09866 [Fonsecaea multimorphosa CBS 102226]|uniref:SMODS and SLOG-associating 2TM effector domain-containing protein n=1 Tax=Fonsecaea multimorphosa CBS 102226 TaxID=1442371 RepID=A0A0D2GY58_9EURO|nr:uncharacterized protein Z520_09866 [Fonsecaea multimorphosa CBS 102226]KIX94480.1 hypothetical protein Z520_09866 [Fonsecaea multimorphosa CBS 102226]OAL20059.1 hypothetical protein AYO22_09209 [Fonsecaea multimorphosa]